MDLGPSKSEFLAGVLLFGSKRNHWGTTGFGLFSFTNGCLGYFIPWYFLLSEGSIIYIVVVVLKRY